MAPPCLRFRSQPPGGAVASLLSLPGEKTWPAPSLTGPPRAPLISRRSGSARTFARSFSSSTVQADGVGAQNHVAELGGRSSPLRLGPNLHAGPQRDRNHRFRTSGEPGRRHIQSFRTRTRSANQGGSSTEGLSRVNQLLIESIQQDPD